jgi:fatty acid desaturase
MIQERNEEDYRIWKERHDKGKLIYGSEEEISKEKKLVNKWNKALIGIFVSAIVMLVGIFVLLFTHTYRIIPVWCIFIVWLVWFISFIVVVVKYNIHNDFYNSLKYGI